MFLGHYGVAFAAKRAAPRTSLGALAFAAQFLDELWPILLLLGVEQVKIVPGLMAASPLDFTHYPYSHSLLMAIVWGILIGGICFLRRRYGRGAWIIEFAIYSIGIAIYLRATRARDRVGRWGLWAFILVLAIIFVTSNSPPPSERALAWTALGLWLFVPWAWWVDKHRDYVGAPELPVERMTGP